MKKVLALLMTLCLLVCVGSIAAEGAVKVYALTMGVRRNAANNTVMDASGIATVTYVRHLNGTTGSADRIYDVMEGETFTLTTAVKEGQEGFYSFLCWIDENGAVIGQETTLELTMDSSKAAFATYVETASRHLVTYKIVGEGSVSVSSDREVIQGVGCASLMHGASAKIRFSPARGYSTYSLKVNGENVSFLSNPIPELYAAVKAGGIKNILGALFRVVKYFLNRETVYSIPCIDQDITIEVGFMKNAFGYKSVLQSAAE